MTETAMTKMERLVHEVNKTKVFVEECAKTVKQCEEVIGNVSKMDDLQQLEVIQNTVNTLIPAVAKKVKDAPFSKKEELLDILNEQFELVQQAILTQRNKLQEQK